MKSNRSIHTIITILILSFSLILNFSWRATTQGIEWIKIERNISYPLRSQDKGLVFEYFVGRAGNTHAYFAVRDLVLSLHSGRYEYKGITSLEIGPRYLKNIFGGAGDGQGQLTITHVEDKRKLYFERELLFSFFVQAPFGTTLLPLPSQPHHYSTNLTKAKTNYLAVFGAVIGGVIAGVGVQQRIEKKSYSYDPLIMLGIILLGSSLGNMEKQVPDVERNALNKKRNEALRAKYEKSLEEAQTKNSIIADNYYVELREIP